VSCAISLEENSLGASGSGTVVSQGTHWATIPLAVGTYGIFFEVSHLERRYGSNSNIAQNHTIVIMPHILA
jgi:hypothetical protein